MAFIWRCFLAWFRRLFWVRIGPLPHGLSRRGIRASPTARLRQSVPAFIDNIATNQRGDARFATLDTNAGVRVVSGFLALWRPRTLKVDAGVTAPAREGFAAITPSDCTGLPDKAPVCGTILNSHVLAANVQYVVTTTRRRTAAQAEAAYYDDRRGKGYSVTDGMGPLTGAWRSAAQQVTTLTRIPADATTVLYVDKGNNTGVGSQEGNRDFGLVVDFLNEMGNNASTEPVKRFYKYARPYRWRSAVEVVPALVPAENPQPATDGGFISGHTAEPSEMPLPWRGWCRSAIRRWSAAVWSWAKTGSWPECTRLWTSSAGACWRWR
ncbi:hypothetical protein WDV93_23130 [Pantoea ananatis]